MKQEKQHSDVMKIFDQNKLIKVAAPMVRYSKLQFRTLLRHYGCDLCYTPMILADSFSQSMKARQNEFTTSLIDAPVITQFASNNISDFISATKLVAPFCDGVDLNCGCPQRWAKHMGIGCVMLETPELISDIIKQCRNQIAKPFTISVKMRVLNDKKATVEICRNLDKCGVSFMAVHGRTASQLTGEVNPSYFKLINENVSCPIIANGGVKNLKECYELQEMTNCKGIMVANGLLTNPMLFAGLEKTDVNCIQNWVNICYNSTLNGQQHTDILDAYHKIPEKPPNLTFQCFHHHLVFMLEKVLPKQKRRIFNNLQNFSDVLEFLNNEFQITPKVFDLETFNRHRTLPLWSAEPSVDDTVCNDYYDKNPGNFFTSKACVNEEDHGGYDLENIFAES